MSAPSACRRLLSFGAKGLSGAFVFLSLLCSLGLGAPAEAVRPLPSPREEMRLYWTRDDVRFVRSWLVAGPFPGALKDEVLADAGREAALRPAEGAALTRPDGSHANWQRQESWGDTVSLNFPGSAQGPAVAYVWTKITRAKRGPALLSLGSDEGLAAWVNGKQVLVRDEKRPFSPDADQVEVEMNEGDNELLVKLSQSSEDWLFSARVLEPGSLAPRPQEIYPAVCDESSDGVTLRTDNGKVNLLGAPVFVELVAPCGVVLASRTAARGEEVRFDSSAWTEGPYEFRCTTRNFEKRAYVTYVPWFKGDCLALAAALADEAAKTKDASAYGLSLRMLAEMVEYRLGGPLSAARGNPWRKIHSPLMEYQELRLEKQGKGSRVRPEGLVRFAYRDEIDGSPQFCRAYLPAAYDPAKKWPLLVNLHGSYPQNPPYVGWWGVDTRHPGPNLSLPSGQGYILLEPHGRGNNEYRYLGIGKEDILRNIEEACRRFNVDPDRVYLSGSSMGGWGAWGMASRRPDLFAALMPIFGGSDYHSELSDSALTQLDPTARFLLERRSSWAMAENLLHMPVLVQHGDADRQVNVDYSRWGVRFLQRWGFDVRYHEYPGRGHEDMIDDASAAKNMEWLLSQRRDPAPRQVRLRSAELRYASAYWVQVGQFASPLAFASVDAEVAGDNLIRLDTDQVLEIALAPPATLVDPSRSLTVVWNGVRREARLEAGRLRLSAEEYAPASLRKTPLRPGSLQDFTRAPFALVVGTRSPDPEMVEACRQKAAALADAWRGWQHCELRVFKDTEIAEEDVGRYSLLLIGGPADNRLAARFADRIPLGIEKERISVDGKTFAARDAAVALLYPHPRHEERYLLVLAANSAGGMNNCELNLQGLPPWDYLVSDGCVSAYGQRAFEHQLRVASGCFNYNWRYDPALCREGDSHVRGAGRIVRYPGTPGSPDLARFEACLGKYQVLEGPLVEIVRNGPKLSLSGQGFRFDLFPLSDSEFWVPAINAQVRLQKDPAGKIVGVEINVDAGTQLMSAQKL